MLELLEKWAELEPEKVAIDTYNDLMFRPERNCTFSVTLVTRFPDYKYFGVTKVEPDNFPAIEYAVRDAIEARGIHYNQGWNINSKGDYWAMLNAEVDTAYASSPAEAILAAYLEYLENEVQE